MRNNMGKSNAKVYVKSAEGIKECGIKGKIIRKIYNPGGMNHVNTVRREDAEVS